MRANASFPYSEVKRLFWVMMNLKLSADLRRSVGGGAECGWKGVRGGGAVDRFGCGQIRLQPLHRVQRHGLLHRTLPSRPPQRIR